MTDSKKRRPISSEMIALVACSLVMAACLSTRQQGGVELVNAQGWSEEHGPTVPHEKFPGDCALCHEGKTWTAIRSDFSFDHVAETGVALMGAHKTAQCLRCHNDRGNVANFAAKGCAGCHEDSHRGRLGNDCTRCHNQSDWQPDGQIAAHDRTRFPLAGAHAGVGCWRCHPGAQAGNFIGAETRCESCHVKDLRRAVDPNHVTLGWTDKCQECHRPTTWRGEGFIHNRFPLDGAHLAIDCSKCHVNKVFRGLASDCASCHVDDAQRTTKPNHITLNLTTRCERCHNTTTWSGARFDHTGITNNCTQCHLTDFQKTTNPNHVTLNFSTNCESCHGTNTWQGARFNHTGITTNCAQCHLTDYQQTTKPNHAAFNLSTSCENCHGTTTWLGARFDHTGITNNCAQCHLTDYQKTTNPNHTALGYSTSCETCHDTNSWKGAAHQHRFDTGGDHGRLGCTDCHTTPGNFAIQSCTHCHEHNSTKMADEHKKVSGYSFSNAACLNCHPNGKKP